jgi:hypothetical protein
VQGGIDRKEWAVALHCRVRPRQVCLRATSCERYSRMKAFEWRNRSSLRELSTCTLIITHIEIPAVIEIWSCWKHVWFVHSNADQKERQNRSKHQVYVKEPSRIIPTVTRWTAPVHSYIRDVLSHVICPWKLIAPIIFYRGSVKLLPG